MSELFVKLTEFFRRFRREDAPIADPENLLLSREAVGLVSAYTIAESVHGGRKDRGWEYRGLSWVSTTTNITTTSNTAYWTYLGYFPNPMTFKRVYAALAIAGAGAQTAEVCLATGDRAPDGANVTMTKVWANGTIDNVSGGAGTGIKGNTVDNSTASPARSHLYVGIRTALATTQPGLQAVFRDWGAGYHLRTTASGALTGAGPWTGTPTTFAQNTHPDLRART